MSAQVSKGSTNPLSTMPGSTSANSTRRPTEPELHGLGRHRLQMLNGPAPSRRLGHQVAGDVLHAADRQAEHDDVEVLAPRHSRSVPTRAAARPTYQDSKS